MSPNPATLMWFDFLQIIVISFESAKQNVWLSSTLGRLYLPFACTDLAVLGELGLGQAAESPHLADSFGKRQPAGLAAASGSAASANQSPSWFCVSRNLGAAS